MLEELFGEKALNIPNNPELSSTYVSTCNAGNGLTYHKVIGKKENGDDNTKKMYAGVETVDEAITKEYENNYRYLKAFGGHAVYGIGTKDIYGQEGCSEVADLVDLLQVFHCQADWSMDRRTHLSQMERMKWNECSSEDKFHGTCKFKSSLLKGHVRWGFSGGGSGPFLGFFSGLL